MPEFTTLSLAGPIAVGDYTILMQSGVPKKLPALTSGRGTRPAKDLIVDGVTHIRVASPVNDIGWTMRSKGIDQNFVQIDPDSVSAWDYSQGDPFFILSRKSNGLCSLVAGPNTCTFTGGISGSTLTVSAVSAGTLAVGQAINTSTVLARSKISALGSGTGGTGTYTLTVAGATVSQTVAPGTALTTGVIINNPQSLELVQDGPDLLVSSSEPNIWDVS